MSKYWYEYVKASYDLVIESEGQSEVFLEDEVEVYVVHLFARNFTRTDIRRRTHSPADTADP